MTVGKILDNRIINSLSCPCCAAPLYQNESANSLLCRGEKPHCYDISSSGHVSFSQRHSGAGDSKEAVRSRRDFLDTGAYERVASAIVDILCEYMEKDAHIVDAGCGEGYYSVKIAERGFAVSGFDLSKEAVIAASKRAKRERIDNTFFGVASVYELPLLSASADAVVNIFAPCVEDEYSRVLKGGGYLLVAYAGAEHLMGLKRAIYDTTYENESRADMPKKLTLVGERRVKYDIRLDSAESIMNLFSMTPYYWRTSEADKHKLCGVSELETTVDIIIAIYKKD